MAFGVQVHRLINPEPGETLNSAQPRKTPRDRAIHICTFCRAADRGWAFKHFREGGMERLLRREPKGPGPRGRIQGAGRNSEDCAFPPGRAG